MVKKLNVREFLKTGCFIASPLFQKVWCLSGETQSYTIPQSCAFYRNNFYCDVKSPWLIGKNFFEFNLQDFFKTINSLKSKKPKITWASKHNAFHKIQYKKLFLSIMNAIQKGKIQKGVPFYRLVGKAQITQKNLLYFFQCLDPLLTNKTLFFYGYWNFKQKTLHFGASPELLFIKNKRLIKTIALAGTSTHPKKDFSTQKMKDEHNYVVHDLQSELLKYGSVKTHPTRVVRFKNYFHKKTQLSVNFKHSDIMFQKLLKSLYPSAAICAYPRKEGQRFLKKTETLLNYHRGYFAAPFGIQTPHLMLCLSIIRGIEWNKGVFSITAGGGIVAQSVFEHEWQEIELKINSIKSIFGLI